MKRILTTVGLVASLAITAAGCGSGSDGNGAGGESAVEVKAYYSAPITQFALASIADANDLFPSSIDVDVQGGDSTTGLALASAGRVQFYLQAAPVPEQMVSGGADVKWAGHWQQGIDVVFLGRNGVESVDDLKGKKFGIIQKGLTLSVMGNEAIRRAGLDPNDLTQLPLGTLPAVNAAFASGTVDAIVTDRASAQKLLSTVKDGKIIFDFYEEVGWNGAGVTVDTAWAKKNPEAAAAFMEGLQKALTMLRDEPEKAKTSLGKTTGLTGADLDFALSNFAEHSTETIQPVSEETEKSVLEVMAAEGNAWAKPDFAKQMIGDPALLSRVSK